MYLNAAIDFASESGNMTSTVVKIDYKILNRVIPS